MISLFQLFFWLLTKSRRVFKFSMTIEVHGDYTPTSAADIFEWQLSKVEPTKAAAYREGHFLLINAWRNLNPQPVEHDTLAVCDLDGKMCFFFWGRGQRFGRLVFSLIWRMLHFDNTFSSNCQVSKIGGLTFYKLLFAGEFRDSSIHRPRQYCFFCY